MLNNTVKYKPFMLIQVVLERTYQNAAWNKVNAKYTAYNMYVIRKTYWQYKSKYAYFCALKWKALILYFYRKKGVLSDTSKATCCWEIGRLKTLYRKQYVLVSAIQCMLEIERINNHGNAYFISQNMFHFCISLTNCSVLRELMHV